MYAWKMWFPCTSVNKKEEGEFMKKAFKIGVSYVGYATKGR
jgi:hypothetical protein